MYYQIKEKLEENEKSKQVSQPKASEESVEKSAKGKQSTEKPKKVFVEKKRSVSKVPTLEGARDSENISTESKVMDEAEKIWNMSPEEFQKYSEKIKRKR